MEAAQILAIVGAMAFFFVGLVTGVWKYAAIRRDERGKAEAPEYVSVGHRAALLYAFACLLLERMVELSALAPAVELGALAVVVLCFAYAVSTYLIHGWLDDTDNQLRRPHRLGRGEVPAWVVRGSMIALAAGEIGGFSVLAWGVTRTLMGAP